jgi:hypothetical protein
METADKVDLSAGIAGLIDPTRGHESVLASPLSEQHRVCESPQR